MPTQHTYTLRRAAGGVSHFARVTIVVCDSQEDTNSVTATVGFEQVLRWIDAANAGIQYATSQTEIGKRVVRLKEVLGTICDTSDDGVFTAAALAVFEVVNEGQWRAEFANDKWEPVRS